MFRTTSTTSNSCPIKALRLFPSLSSPFSSTPSLPFSSPSLLVAGTLSTSGCNRLTFVARALKPRQGSESEWWSRRGFGIGNYGLCVVTRCVSSASAAQDLLDWNEPVAWSEVGNGEVEDAAKLPVPVRAYLFSTSVDLKSLVEQNKPNYIPPSSRMTNYALFKFGSLKSEPDGLAGSLRQSDSSYMVVFHYGSIVLFNICDQEVDRYLKLVEKYASGILPEMRKDEYEVREQPTLSTWMEGGLDYLMLQSLNIDSIRTIGSVLGQSIALDYYVRQVDGMVAEFTDINRELEKTGTFTMEAKKLFQLVGKANSNLADVILKLGLFERSDIAWKDAKYAQIWEYMRDEFELTQRFASLDFKLKFVEHNIRFLQEILQNRRSDFLEWVIIILIVVEILLSIYDVFLKSAISPF